MQKPLYSVPNSIRRVLFDVKIAMQVHETVVTGSS